jgi:hypothetical protein
MKMKVLQISKHACRIFEPDALEAGGLLAAVEYAPTTSICGEW